MNTRWDEVQRIKQTSERPDHWPKGVYALSVGGLSLLGINEKTNKLYWDGKELRTARVVQLGIVERVLASMAALGTFGHFIIAVLKFCGPS